MRRIFLSLLTCSLMAGPGWATTWEFDILARIDSSFLRPNSVSFKVPVGSTLKGRMTYSLPASQQFGGDYLYNGGLETLSVSTDQGFSLNLSNRVVSIASQGGTDYFSAQSFISEDPNGWNLVFNLITTGWLAGQIALPTRFPTNFSSAYISAYFLDELDIVQSVEASILSINPVGDAVAPIPVPPAGILLGGLMILGVFRSKLARGLRR